MPSVYVLQKDLIKEIGEKYASSPEIFDALCFDFGIELDEVTSLKLRMAKETGKDIGEEIADSEKEFKIDIPANRYDLLCLEGLSRSLRVFTNQEEPPVFRTSPPRERMIISREVGTIRPFVVCAVLRDITFDEIRYESFIQLQEKLHQNICRKRTLVSIGTHDLDTIKGPFTYQAKPPSDIKFVALDQTVEWDGHQLMQNFEKSHLRTYLDIIRSSPLYPVIYDTENRVLSLPPIINGDHSKIRLETKNVFIEVTATDKTKAEVVLNTMVTMFSQYCKEPFVVEQVEVQDPNGEISVYPDLSNRMATASISYINKSLGLSLSPEQIITLLKRMSIFTELSTTDSDTIRAYIPPTRSDILQECDILEDVAIAYGFNNLPITIPKTPTTARQQPLNKLSELIRRELANAGYTECLTLALCSHAENYDSLLRPYDKSAVVLSNPTTAEFQIGRTTLLVGLLKSLQNNKKMPMPLRIFEVSDVIIKDHNKDVGARNCRRVCALYSAKASGFEFIHGLLDQLMLLLGVPTSDYFLSSSEDPAFFPGRRGDVILRGNKIGVVGVLHPEVLGNYDLIYPVSALELDLEPFV